MRICEKAAVTGSMLVVLGIVLNLFLVFWSYFAGIEKGFATQAQSEFCKLLIVIILGSYGVGFWLWLPLAINFLFKRAG